jgi:D-sedoheptulose 7-phosphate isomerase
VTDRLPTSSPALAPGRSEADAAYFDANAGRLAELCHRMAERFVRGGRLLGVGASPQARSDARHVAVEFVHPVIVGKRALPAIAVTGDGASLAGQVDLAAEPGDIVMAFEGEAAGQAVALARGRGCLTIGFEPCGAEWQLDPETGDPFARQELAETAYHLLWELVHVFFEHRGLLQGRDARPVHDSGASAFLYPFLAEAETDLGSVLDDVRGSVAMKAEEIGTLRASTLAEHEADLRRAAEALRQRLERGGRLLTLGNGGSATDAMDAAADMRSPPTAWPARRALDLTEDPAVLTAIANDIGTDAVFSRQVIAHGREADALLALSTSGNSGNVVEALSEARRRGMLTIAMVGYDGGNIAAEGLADHVVVVRSEHIPRIQEAQATAWHVLRRLVEDA